MKSTRVGLRFLLVLGAYLASHNLHCAPAERVMATRALLLEQTLEKGLNDWFREKRERLQDQEASKEGDCVSAAL